MTVAVVDSGADAGHPMLKGRVADAVDLTGTGARDCYGHGTGVAALIAGSTLHDRRSPLGGVAPAARLLIVKQQNGETDDRGGDRLPAAIRRAADLGADVINVSIRTADAPALRRAVDYALAKNAVVVAAAGNVDRPGGSEGPAYPASYPGVLSVGSLTADGTRDPSSSVRSRVDVGAPGKDVPIAWPGGGWNPRATGTSFAAAFASGVAVLVRARHPELDAAQVVRRIVRTADGTAGPGTGAGMIDPLQAVTAVLPGEPATGPVPSRPAPGPARFAAPARPDARTRTVALAVAGGALGLAGIAALAGVVVPRGRARGWRPGRVDLAVARPPAEPVADAAEGGTIGGRS
ncbi:S8 family serine peptidase [Actinomadura rayongensis]|uniref:S8 family serine peptidase n=1 Tax=Actinomadura rayongensis TaxID=1429076 RepID=A0A6I4W4I0_9ACTN|nr:S8 family serine peptidase [Actinomadura rayongensis]